MLNKPNVNFAIKSAKTTKCRVNGIRTVCCANDDDIGTLLESIHEGKQLRHNSALDFSVRL